jgi:hypothetical protein
MTEKLEDFVPPKHRAAQAEQKLTREQEIELERAVGGALAEVKKTEQASEQNKVQDFAELGAQAILKYAEASAIAIEQTGDEVLKDAEKVRDACFGLAEDIRHVARVQAQAVQRAMERGREVGMGTTALRKAFHADISKEREEAEAQKARASSAV